MRQFPPPKKPQRATLEKAYEVGQIYSLDEIQRVVASLKSVGHRSTDKGPVYFYREKESNHFWVGGPWRGPGTNFFIFLGPQKTKGTFLKAFGQALIGVAKDMGANMIDALNKPGNVDSWDAGWDAD